MKSKSNNEDAAQYSEALVGLGCNEHVIAVYIANRPPLIEYQQLIALSALTSGEITAIGLQCGNGWRKVFNVYAKLLYALTGESFSFKESAATWQQYRDVFLLQPNSKTALLFSAPETKKQPNTVHIIIGRTYAKSLINSNKIEGELTWIDEEFAINTEHKIIVCPYFDYRQLSNIKIERLASMIDSLF